MKYLASPQSDVAPFVASRILSQLQQGKRVLWLLSGGSGGAVCVTASKLLKEHDLSNLIVTMSDERHGDIDHPDENVAQLMADGLSLDGAVFYRPLIGQSRDDTTTAFSAWVDEQNHTIDYRIAVLGIGEDGHTCGIKPQSAAVTATTSVASFAGDDFERITITPAFLKRVDEAIVQAYGNNKHSVVERLLNGEGDRAEYPMLTIQDIPTVTVFSDYKEKSNEHSN